jgi:hypothetical protein
MPTPPLISTNGLSLAARMNSPEGGNSWMLVADVQLIVQVVGRPATRFALDADAVLRPLFASADSE